MTQPASAGAAAPQEQDQDPVLMCVISKPIFPIFDESRLQARARSLLGAMATRPQQQVELVANALKEAQQQSSSTPVVWIVSRPHPIVEDFRIVRMVLDDGGIEIYSESTNRTRGMRNFIPIDEVQLTEEAMTYDTFLEELARAEMGGDDGDDDDDVEDDVSPSPQPSPVMNTTNGQSS